MCSHILVELSLKYQFNEIFSKAWLKSLVPANVISGFKTCGIHPFDPQAVILVTRW